MRSLIVVAAVPRPWSRQARTSRSRVSDTIVMARYDHETRHLAAAGELAQKAAYGTPDRSPCRTTAALQPGRSTYADRRGRECIVRCRAQEFPTYPGVGGSPGRGVLLAEGIRCRWTTNRYRRRPHPPCWLR